jgi:subtilisin family serine protease
MNPAPPLTPEEDESGPVPFAGAAGRGIRVAVIDSGVNGRHPHIIAAVDGGVSSRDDGEFAAVDYSDQIGHGTAVMAAIQEKAPDARFFAVKVFHTALRTTAANLIRAIEWCIEHKMDVVNLSLGTTNHAHAKKFEQVAAEAVDGGTLLVAARGVDGRSCYPGCLPGVFGVDVDWDCPRNRFRWCATGDNIVFFASGYPRPAPGIPRTRNVHGISFAVANMTAFLVRACETHGEERTAGRQAMMREALLREGERKPSL